ncbi:MAG: CvpA family protein [Kiritimatiellae bacterium]|nr:CvpA family protein [Kiritimatiellia bacterium]
MIGPFHILDFVAVAAVLIGLLQGLRRKLSREFSGTFRVILAFALTLALYGAFGRALIRHSRLDQHPQAAYGVSFLLLLAGTSLALRLAQLLLKRLMQVTFNTRIDRVGGAVAGGVRTAVYVIAVFLFMAIWPHPYLHEVFTEQSAFGHVIAGRLLGKESRAAPKAEAAAEPKRK